MNKAELLLRAFDIGAPALKPSLLFFQNGEMMIMKKDAHGVYQTKPACKDPNYEGNRYIWVDEININS